MRRSASNWRRRRTPKVLFPPRSCQNAPFGARSGFAQRNRSLPTVGRQASLFAATRAPHRRHHPATSQAPNTPTRPGRGGAPVGASPPWARPDPPRSATGTVSCAINARSGISSSCSRCTPGWSARAEDGADGTGSAGRWPAAGRRRPVTCSAGRWPAPGRRRPVTGSAGRWPAPGRRRPATGSNQRVCTYCAHKAGNATPLRVSHSAGV